MERMNIDSPYPFVQQLPPLYVPFLTPTSCHLYSGYCFVSLSLSLFVF
jgi:hypothetical protein